MTPTRKATFLDRLSSDHRSELLALGRPRQLSRGDYLIREGWHGSEVVVITAGWAKIVAVTSSGEEVVLGLRGPGDLAGELAALDDVPGGRSASVQALTRVQAVSVPGDEFVSFLHTHSEASVGLLREFISRLRETSSRAVRHGTLDVPRHLAQLIIELAGRERDNPSGAVVIDLGLTQADVAGLLSCSRDSVAKALATLRAEGLIITGRRTITIPSTARLNDFADG